MVGEVSSYFGKRDLFPLCVIVFQLGIMLGMLPYFVGGDEINKLISVCKIETRLATLPGRFAARESMPLR